MKIHPVVTELFHTNRQTDGHDEANSRLSQFFPSRQKVRRYNGELISP